MNDQMSGLSPEAEVFIPRGASPQTDGRVNIQQIPSYMTNCYPFVQTDYRMPWVSGSRPPRHYHGYHGGRKHRLSGGNHGNRMPGNKYMDPSNPFMLHGVPPPVDMGWNNPLNYSPNLPQSSLEFPGALTNGMPFDGGTSESQNSRHQEDSGPGKRHQKRDNSSHKKNSNESSVRKVGEKEGAENFDKRNEGKKKGERNKSGQRGKQNSITTGVRKGVQGSPTPKEERSPRGIIFKEISIQTEFPDRFANKTLAAFPCPFFSPQSHDSGPFLYSSDSEVDSDSGYSSPQHKRNLTSCGTQPMVSMETVVCPQETMESQHSLSNSIPLEKKESISKSRQNISNSDKLGQNKSSYPEKRQNIQNSVQSGQSSVLTPSAVPQHRMSYAMIAQKVPSPKPSVQSENTPSANICDKPVNCKKSNLSSGEITHSAKKSVTVSSKSIESAEENKNKDCVEDNDGTSSGKKKRKRIRKRTKKKKTDEPASSQEVVEDVELHFEDEDEFPDLLGSVQTSVPSGERSSSLGHENNSVRETTPLRENNNFSGCESMHSDSKQSPGRSFYVINPGGDNMDSTRETTAAKPANYSSQNAMTTAVSSPQSYSSILKNKKSVVTFDERQLQQNAKLMKESKSKDTGESAEIRVSRKRRKRREMMNQAAEEELAEIGLEQDMLRELNLKPATAKKLAQKGAQKGGQKGASSEPPASQAGILNVAPQTTTPSGKKSKQSIALDLGAMIDALEKKKDVPVQKKKETPTTVDHKPKKPTSSQGAKPHNMLDASAPMLKRGKERETPKPKKPSPLKKVILKEREEKKKLRLLDDSVPGNSGVPVGIGVISAESDLSQDAYSFKGSADYGGMTPASNDLSPISQTSPISMSPLSPGASPLSSEVNSPIAGTIGKEAVLKIHSRRFREYCNQVLNKDIDNCCTNLLQDLVRFQDRVYHKEPNKAKSKRRLVLGLREVTKHLKLKKIKCVIISPNLEKIQSKGGLDDALNNILNLCNQQNVPFVFALGRRSLGRACAKLVPVSVVGIFNYDGTDDNFKGLMDLTEEARQAYKEMVSVIEKEIREYPTRGAAASAPHIYAHMGHSRTPSGASVLSFTSSILSEPISENYPHSEPETDSKGYEIIKDSPELDQYFSSTSAIQNQGIPYPMGKGRQSKVKDFDDGNEADTEDYGELPRVRVQTSGSGDVDKDSDNDSEQGSRDTVEELPHIDSIHSSTYDLSTEILSQHSGRTIENCEAMSTHSSRTLGDGSSTILAEPGDRSKHDTPKSMESPSSTLQRGKVIDEERIQNWVDETQSRLENLQLQCSTEDSDNTNSESETEENSVSENEKQDSVEVKGQTKELSHVEKVQDLHNNSGKL